MKTSRFISLLLCVVMIMSLFTGLAGSASADDVITHEVQSGEILMKICEKYGLNYYNCKNAIMQLNGFTNENQLAKLTVGQKLKLPGSNAVAGTVSTTTATVTTTTVGGTTMTTTSYGLGGVAGGSAAFYLTPYTVKAGDTLNKICNELGSNYYYYAPVIQGINALANPNQIHAGQVLLIPTASAAGAASAVVGHVVQPGETMSSIANQYGINYQAQRQLINGLNRRDNMDKIYVGQTVLIPGGAAPAAGVVTTTTTGTATATTAGTAAASAAASGAYQISLTAAANGSPYAVVNNVQFATRANAGETVNIVPSPKAGYAVRDIQVIRTDSGTDIPVSNYAFTMPNSSVQVTVFYSRGFVINKVASPYGSFDTMIYGTNANTAFFGDEVVLAIYPKSGYNVKLENGVYYQKNDFSIEKVYVQKDPVDGLYKFKMPNYEIRLTVVFQISTYYTLSSFVPSGGGYVEFYVDGAKTDRALEGQTVTMKMVPHSGWVFDSADYEAPGGGLDALRVLVKDGKVTKVNANTYTFVMKNINTNSGKVIFKNRNTYALNADIRGGHGSLSFQIVSNGTYDIISKDVSRAQPGQLVEVTFRPDNKYFYKKDDIGVGAAFTKNNSTQVTWEPNPNRFIFRMPSEDVTIVARFVNDDSKIYYDVNVEYDASRGIAIVRDDVTGQPITKALAGQAIRIETSAYDNFRVTGIQRVWEGHEEWLSFTWDKKVTVSGMSKQNKTETFKVNFEADNEYTYVDWNAFRQDTKNGTPIGYDKIVLVDVPEARNIKVGTTIKFHTLVKRAGFSVGEVWKLGGSGDRMLSPTEEGGNNYEYTVTSGDKGKTIQFLAVQIGKEPVHYVIPEYTIANTGITNVNNEPLYTVHIDGLPDTTVGPVYGMGANIAVNDNDIKSSKGVKVKITIPKTKHKFVGAGEVLYYQADTVSIRFSDYVLDNYKVMEDPSETEFVYEFWYKKDPLTDLNIMVNYKETGTSSDVETASGSVTPPTITIGGKTVTLTDGKGTITTSDGTTVITITGKS